MRTQVLSFKIVVLALFVLSMIAAFAALQPFGAHAIYPAALDTWEYETSIAAGRGGYPEGVTWVDSSTIMITESDYGDAEGPDPSEFSQVAKYSLSSTATPSATYGTAGSGTNPPNFDWPAHVAVSESGDIVVADSNNNRIMVLTSSGSYKTSFGAYGTGIGQFAYPMGVAIQEGAGSTYYIYVADTENGRIQKFSSGGAFLGQFGIPVPSGETGYCYPDGIFVDELGGIYVAEAGFSRVYKFPSSSVVNTQTVINGTPSIRINKWASGTDSLGNPQGVTVDHDGAIFIADTGNDRVVVCDAAGNYVTDFGSSGSGEGEFSLPEDLIVDDLGNIYVADTDNDRIVKMAYSPDTSDETPPVTTSNIPAAWTQGPFGMVLSAVDASSTVTGTYYSTDGTTPTVSYTSTVTVSDEGTTTVKYYSVDAVGNEETPITKSLRIDSTPPTTNHDGQAVYVETAVINFTASDPLSGVANIYWRLGAQQSWQSGNKLTHSVEGSYTIQYYADDVAGNVQPTQFFHFDIIPEDDDPPVTISNIPVTWQSQPVTVTLSASDVITEVEHTYYSTDGTTPTIEYTAPFRVSTEGLHPIKYYSVDTAGNEETVNQDTLKIDMTDPQTTSDAQSSYVESGTVILSPSDNLSGIFETRYKLNNDPWSVGTTITLSGRGKQTIEYYSVDKANNTENSHISQIDLLEPDVDPPVTSSNIPFGWTPGNPYELELLAFDAVSGVFETVYAIDGATSTVEYSVEETETTYVIDIPVYNEGTHTVMYYSTDARGNTETPTVEELKIDNTPPVSSTDATEGAVFVESGRVNFFSSDALSGVANTWYSINGGAFIPGQYVDLVTYQDYAITYYSRDGAGNSESTKTVNVSVIPPDTDPPITTSDIPLDWVDTTVTVSLTATDTESGVERTYYSTNGGQSYNIYYNPFDISTEGITNVAFYSRDYRGNLESPTISPVKIDYTPPATTSDNAGLYYDEALMTLTPVDAGSGVAETYWRVRSYWGGNTGWTTGTVVQYTQWGYHTLDYYSVDELGHTETVVSEPFTVRFREVDYEEDHERVVLQSPFLGSWTREYNSKSSADYYAWAEDDGARIHLRFSGVGITWYGTEGPDYGTADVWLDGVYQGEIDLYEPTLKEDRELWSETSLDNEYHHVLIERTGEKNTGSSGTKLSLDRVTIEGAIQQVADTVAPVTSSDAPSGWTTGPVTITLDSTDATTGVDYVLYSPTGGTPNTTYTAPFDLWSEGTNILKYYGVDARGNTEVLHTEYVQIDDTPPVTTSNAQSDYVDQASVTLTPTDALSGHASTHYRVDGSAWTTGTALSISDAGKHTLEYYSVDAVGNTESIRSVDLFVKDRFEETESLLLFKGAWADATSPALSGGSYKYAWKTGLTAHIAFDGVKLDWITTKAPNYGVAKVTLDGGDPEYVDLYSATYRYKSLVWSTGELAPGRHEIAIEWTGTKNAASTGFSVGVDALDVAGSLLEADIYDPITTSDIDEAWQNGPVAVTLSADDVLAGVANTYYRLDGGADTTYTAPFQIGSEGTTTVEYYSVDKRGNVESATSTMVRIDDTAPASSSDIDEAWQSGPVTVTLAATDNGYSGVQNTYYTIDGGAPETYTAPFEIALEGTTTVEYWSVDIVGNTESPLSQVVRIDDTDAVTTSDIDEAWQNGPVDVTLAATDTVSGVYATYYRLDGGADTTYTAPFQIGSEGTTTVEYYSVDKRGNVESATSTMVRIDDTAPASSSDIDEAWQSGPVTVTLAATDNGYSGVQNTYYTIDGGAPETYTAPFEIALEGTTTVEYWSVDIVGNTESPLSQVVRIDDTDAVTTSDIDEAWQNGPVDVTLAATDTVSGVYATYYRLDGGADTTYTAPFQIGSEGTTTVEYYSVDKRGNVESATSTMVRIDDTAPASSSDIDEAWQSGPVTVTLAATDNGYSGVQNTYYTIDGGAPETYTAPFEIALEGTTTVEYWSVDIVGNTESPLSQVVRIDDTAPVTTSNAQSDYVDQASVTLTPTDALSGHASTHYRVDGSAWTTGTALSISDAGKHTLEYYSVDAVGNTESIRSVDLFVKDRFEETESLLLFKGAWADATSPALSGGSYKYAWKTGLTAHIAFDGVKLDWITTKAPNYGVAKVTLDGGDPEYVDLYSATYRYKSLVWSTGELAPGRHEIAIEWTGTKNAASTGFSVGVDALDVAGSLLEADIYDPITTSDIDEAWQNGPVDVTLSADDVLAGVANTYYRLDGGADTTYTAPFQIGSEGTTTVEYYSVDKRGNVENAHTEYVRIDDTPPVTTSNAQSDYVDQASVTLTPTDALSGHASTHYRVDGSAWTTGTALSISDAGKHTLEYYSVDAVGNTESIRSVDLFVKDRFEETESLLLFKGAWADATSPALSGGSYKYAWKTGLTAHIAFDGVKLDWITTKAPNYGVAKVTLDGGDPEYVDLYSATYRYKSLVWSTGELAPGRHEIAIEWTGTKNAASTGFSVGVDALDVAGSLLEADIYDPITTSDIDEAWQNGPVDVTLSADDVLAGVANTYYRLDGGADTTYTAPFQIGSEGTTTVEYYSVDKRGNVESATSTMVRIDDTAPASSSDIDEAWQSGPVTVTLAATDNGYSGVQNTYYTIDGGAPETYTAPFEIALEGTTTVEYWSVDIVGNTESPLSQVVRIDDTPPTTASDIQSDYVGQASISLTATDAVSGVASTHYRVDDSAWTTGTALTVSDPDTHTVEYYSVDNRGNAEDVNSETLFVLDPIVRVEQKDARLAYVGTWDESVSLALSGGSYLSTYRPGSAAVVKFDGTQVDWITTRASSYGIAKLTLDGGAPEYVDLYSATYLFQNTVWSSGELTDGVHTLQIEWTGTKNASSSNVYVGIDAFDVTGDVLQADPPAVVTTRYEQGDTRVGYSGSWTTANSSALSGGSYATANKAGSSAVIAFDGISLEWITTKAPSYGIAKVTVDGGAPEYVDLYAAAYAFKQPVWSTGVLTDAAHTVVIEWTGTKHASSSGSQIGIDALDVAGTLTQADPLTPALERYEETDARILFEGVWATGTSPALSAGSYNWAYSEGAVARIEFVGTALEWITTKAPNYGIAKVTLDGGTPEYVDLYSATYAYKSSVWQASQLADEAHTLVIEWDGTKNASSTGTYIGVDAVDVAGTLSQASNYYEETDARILFEGVWATGTSPALSAGSYNWAYSEGAVARIEFVGTALEWITTKAPNYGIAKVTLDGGTPEYVDLYSATYAYKRSVWQASQLADEAHTLVIEWDGTKNASSTGTYIGVDAVDVVGYLTQAVTPLEPRNRYDDDAGFITYGGSWYTASSPALSGGTYEWTTSQDASVSVTFYGTKLDWITTKAPNYGIAEISIDGGAPVQVDLYSPTYAYQRPVWSTGNLALGAHTVVIFTTGQKNPSSSNKLVGLDAVDIYGEP